MIYINNRFSKLISLIVILALILTIFPNVIFAEEKPTNIALGKKAIAYDSGDFKNGNNVWKAGFEPDKALDGTKSSKSRWISSENAKGPQYFEVDLGLSYAVGSVKIFTTKGYPWGVTKIQYLNNGSWVDAPGGNLAKDWNKTANSKAVNFKEGFNTSKIRLSIELDGNIRLEELEIYSSSQGESVSSNNINLNINDYKNSPNATAIEAVTQLGIINAKGDNFKPDDPMTKSEMTVAALRAIGMFESSDSLKGDTPFKDVDSKNKYSGYINYAYQLGIVSGNDGMFNPDEEVTFEQVVKMLIKAANYDTHAEARGGYPIGYINVAKDIKLFNNLKLDSYEKITRAQIAQMIYNLLDTSSVTKIIIGNKTDITVNNTTILFDYHGLVKEKGVVYAADKKTILKDIDLSNDNYVYIGSKKLEGLSTYVANYIGKSVYYFYNPEDDKLKAICDSGNNNSVVIKSEDINSDKTTRYSLVVNLEDDNKEKTYKINAKANMMENGRAVFPIIKEDLLTDWEMYDDGNLTIIDNNDDGIYDIVIAQKSVTVIVDSVDIHNEIIYGKYNNSSDDLSVYDDVIVTNGGKSGGIDIIAPGDILTVLKDRNNTIIEVKVESQKINGKLTALESDDIIYIDDKKYELSNYYMNKVTVNNKAKLGDAGTFFIVNNKIVEFLINSNLSEFQLGYIETAYLSKNALQKTFEMLIFNKDGFSKYKIIDNVKLNGETFKMANKSDDIIYSTILPGSTQVNGQSYYREIVYYKADGENITEIVNYNGDKFKKLNYSGNKRLRGTSNIILQSYSDAAKIEKIVTKDTIVIEAYNTTTELKEDRFKFSTANKYSVKDVIVRKAYSYQNPDSLVPIEGATDYDYSESIVDVLVIESSIAAGADNQSLKVVKNISQGINEKGENAYYVNCFQAGNKPYKAEVIESVANKLSAGDVVHFGYIGARIETIDANISKFSDGDKEVVTSNGVNSNWWAANGRWIIKGKVLNYSNGYLVVSIDGTPYTYRLPNTIPVTLIKRKGASPNYTFDSVSVGSAKDIIKGSYIVVYSFAYVPKEAVIYYNN